MRSLAVIILLVALAAPVFATPRCDVMAQANEPDLTSALNLSKDQQARLEAVHQRYAAQKQAIRQNVAARRQEMVTQMSSDKPDRAAVDRCLADIVSLEGRRQKLIVDEYFEVMQILRPDQQAIFRTQVVKRMAR